MSTSSTILAASCALLSLLSGSAYSQPAPAKKPPQSAGVDPGAVKVLRGMTDYLGGLKQFSVVALNMREDMLISGHRVDYEVTSKVIVSRPDKLQSRTHGPPGRPDLLLRRHHVDALQPIRQGLRVDACTGDDRGNARFRKRVARAGLPDLRPDLSQRLSAADAGRHACADDRQGGHRRRRV